MEFITIYCNEDPQRKWFVRKNNIGKRFMSAIIESNFMERYKHAFKEEEAKQYVRKLLKYKADKQEDETAWRYFTRKLSTDSFRNFTVQDYIEFSSLLKRIGMKYNKKKDTFI
jgi:hypothetical protein